MKKRPNCWISYNLFTPCWTPQTVNGAGIGGKTYTMQKAKMLSCRGFAMTPGRVHAPAIYEVEVMRVRDLVKGMWIIHPISKVRCKVDTIEGEYRTFRYIRQTSWGMTEYKDPEHVINIASRSMQFCQIINRPLCFRRSADYYRSLKRVGRRASALAKCTSDRRTYPRK